MKLVKVKTEVFKNLKQGDFFAFMDEKHPLLEEKKLYCVLEWPERISGYVFCRVINEGNCSITADMNFRLNKHKIITIYKFDVSDSIFEKIVKAIVKIINPNKK